jgi:DNA (cytosine-5)-methyltransferase 1
VERNVIDLFAGCGGLALGLHHAGWESVLAIERDPMAFETIDANFLREDAPYPTFAQWPDGIPKRSQTLEEVLADSRQRRVLSEFSGRVTLLAGGPPCQGFSVGGIRDGADARNELVHAMLDVVDLVRAPLVLIENVEGIARRFKSKPGMYAGSVADEVVRALQEKGYDSSFSVIDASDFGVPQTRRRVLILGVSHEIDEGRGLSRALPAALEFVREGHLTSLDLPTDRPITVGEAIADLDGDRRVACPDSPGFDSGTYEAAHSAYAKLMRRAISSRTIPDSHRFSKHGDRIRRLYEDAHKTQTPGRLSKAFLRGWGTKKDKKVLLDPRQPSSTITTHPDEFIHYGRARNITVREMARLQSFPDDFVFRGRYTINGPRRRHDVPRCSQVGNAVPPLLARAVGLALAELLEYARGNSGLSLEEATSCDQLHLAAA